VVGDTPQRMLSWWRLSPPLLSLCCKFWSLELLGNECDRCCLSGDRLCCLHLERVDIVDERGVLQQLRPHLHHTIQHYDLKCVSSSGPRLQTKNPAEITGREGESLRERGREGGCTGEREGGRERKRERPRPEGARIREDGAYLLVLALLLSDRLARALKGARPQHLHHHPKQNLRECAAS
jgi:hypothetical protein